jgi:metacaspase-1
MIDNIRLIIICLLVSTYVPAQTKKHALIFAVGNYPKNSGWAQIASLRDMDLVVKTLHNQKFEDIRTIKEDKVTVNGISNAFEQLIKDVNPGDVVLIHFSCHGEQVASTNNAIGGLDQCVVTYNAIAPDPFDPSIDYQKRQANYYRDHVLGNYLKRLRTKLGKDGDVAVFLDFCHSGGATRGVRGNGKVRGGKLPLVPRGIGSNKRTFEDSSNLSIQLKGSNADENKLASFVVISATKPDELDTETKDDNGKDIGPLSYAYCKAFEQLSLNNKPTYKSFFNKIFSLMDVKVKGQTPVLEGNGIDRTLLGGKYVEQKPYIEIASIVQGNQLIIKSGLLAGLDKGAKVLLHPSDISDPSNSKALASGTIIKADYFTSTVQLDKDPQIKQATEGKIFVTDKVFRVDPVRINIATAERPVNIGFTNAEITKIKNGLKDFALVQFSEVSPELLLVKGNDEDSIKIPSTNYLFTTLKNSSNNIDSLQERLQRYAQYKFLRAIELKDPEVNMDVRLTPIINGKADITKIGTKMINSRYEYFEDDTLVLWIKNTGKKAAYINILDLQPDGKINPILPFKAERIYSYDLNIKADSAYLLSNYKIALVPPCGTEIFKIFISTKEIDLEDIADTKGATTKGNLDQWEKLLSKSYTLKRGGVPSSNNTNGTTLNIPFIIKPKR